jgi:hypothetical protein
MLWICMLWGIPGTIANEYKDQALRGARIRLTLEYSAKMVI